MDNKPIDYKHDKKIHDGPYIEDLEKILIRIEKLFSERSVGSTD